MGVIADNGRIAPAPCTQLDKKTFLFAYSNDFDLSVITEVLDYFQEASVPPQYSNFAGIRFDTKDEEDFKYSNIWDFILSYVETHLPNPSLSFDNNSTGSDVLTTIDRFLDSTEVPVCGSRILILVKRYPNEIDVSKIVEKMRHYHSYLTIIASREPSGGNQPGILYDIASKTNGLCGFDKDSEIGEAVQYLETRYTPYIEYAVNPQVSGSGRIQLAPLQVPNYNNYWFQMTIQDDGPISAVKKVFLSWSNEKNHGLMGFNGTLIGTNGYGNHLSNEVGLNEFTYNVTLDYEYSDTKSRRLQIRVYGSVVSPVSVWPPYDN